MEEKGLLKSQKFEEGLDGSIAVINHFNDDEVLKENYELRKDGSSHMSEQGWCRLAARIPTFLFFYEPLLREYHRNVGKDEKYAKRCLNTWLMLYPEYYASRGRI